MILQWRQPWQPLPPSQVSFPVWEATREPKMKAEIVVYGSNLHYLESKILHQDVSAYLSGLMLTLTIVKCLLQ